MNYKWVISPDIVEVNTNLLPLRGFAICKYNKVFNSTLLNFHNSNKIYKYKCEVGDLKVPESFEARYSHYFLKNHTVFYLRRIGPLSFKFSYNLKTKTIKTNYLNWGIPFEMGQVWPIGLHLSNIISVDLLLKKNLLFLRGAAIEYNNETICIFSPPRTGKTIFIETLLKRGAKYIAEDIILTNGREVYLIPPNDYKFYAKNIELVENFKKKSRISRLIFTIPTNQKKSYKEVKDIPASLLEVYSKNLLYDTDRFIHAILYFQNLSFTSLENKRYTVIRKLIKNSKIAMVTDLKNVLR
jgi:hypothetical protein